MHTYLEPLVHRCDRVAVDGEAHEALAHPRVLRALAREDVADLRVGVGLYTYMCVERE